MAFPSPAAKAAELARLSSLFDSLASSQSRIVFPSSSSDTASSTSSHNTHKPVDARARVQSLPRPREYDAVLKNLYDGVQAEKATPIPSSAQACMPPRTSRIAGDANATLPPHPIASDITMSDPSPLSHSGASLLAKFPLDAEAQVPFTFKHMLHKLYEKEDWLRTLEEMLERSKEEFKPLAEKAASVTDGKRRTETFSHGAGVRRRPSNGGRRQTQSASNTTKRPLSPFASASTSVSSATQMNVDTESLRVLKKRCIGRRTVSASLANDENRASASATGRNVKNGTWVYASAVSSIERPAPATYAPLSLPPTSPSTFTSASLSTPPASPTASVFSSMSSETAVSSASAPGAGWLKRRVSGGEDYRLGKMGSFPLREVTNMGMTGRGLVGRMEMVVGGENM